MKAVIKFFSRKDLTPVEGGGEMVLVYPVDKRKCIALSNTRYFPLFTEGQDALELNIYKGDGELSEAIRFFEERAVDVGCKEIHYIFMSADGKSVTKFWEPDKDSEDRSTKTWCYIAAIGFPELV